MRRVGTAVRDVRNEGPGFLATFSVLKLSKGVELEREKWDIPDHVGKGMASQGLQQNITYRSMEASYQ